jgi:hypothetical protein
MTPYESESLSLLRQILSAVQAGAIRSASATQPPTSVAVADDRDLDSQWGDEEVRVSPRDWTGESMKGRRMSECPPAFLDMLADTLDYFARKNEASGATTTSGKPKAVYDRKGAARARGWAARLRSGWTAPTFDVGGPSDDSYAPTSMAMAGPYIDGSDDDIPF